MGKVIQSPELRTRIDDIDAEPIGNSAKQMVQQIKGETEEGAKVTIE